MARPIDREKRPSQAKRLWQRKQSRLTAVKRSPQEGVPVEQFCLWRL
jgi:hypothetical protein